MSSPTAPELVRRQTKWPLKIAPTKKKAPSRLKTTEIEIRPRLYTYCICIGADDRLALTTHFTSPALEVNRAPIKTEQMTSISFISSLLRVGLGGRQFGGTLQSCRC